MLGLKFVLIGMNLVLAATFFGPSAGLLVYAGLALSIVGLLVGPEDSLQQLSSTTQ
ncbi:nodulation efficiency protein NfeD [Natrialba magadii ATCC 43099]|uniref:Nodulation efficiency protein NfeD n=1 Tax=Natrialba magadii (strain ATCC 43099 / DSM 3394 / CCM 3739 / CIP 104546 / IAM 13178 / JCM 8861 / NBRC 102185 / NCIMB 2190 / MS3) TaxID=547559 RepID=D3SV99_NATMM|nr:nodulation efficiency protein NfeD [Natrialba magadii ATCC 43099]ELY29530.1 nodulation efficiency protein NfeD [Natrialba magadii ATCC 43099]